MAIRTKTAAAKRATHLSAIDARTIPELDGGIGYGQIKAGLR